MRNIRYQTLRTISYVAGKAPGIEMIRGVKTHKIALRVDGSATIAGGAGGAVVAEGVQNLLSRVKLIENGETTVEVTGRLLAYLTGRGQKQAANITQLSAAAAATYAISADLIIDFAHIWGADPSETCYVERDSRFPTLIEIEFASDPEAVLITGTGLTLDSLTVVPTQQYDPVSSVMPFFLPRMKLITSDAVTGTQVDFPVFLYPEAGARIESVILHALTDQLTNASVLNGNVTLRGDKFRYVDRVSRFTILNELRQAYAFPAPSAGYLEFLSRFYGKLSEMFITGQDDNFRAEVDCTNPGTSTVFNALMLEKLPIPGYTRALPPGW
jgi:hypothetical protein